MRDIRQRISRLSPQEERQGIRGVSQPGSELQPEEAAAPSNKGHLCETQRYQQVQPVGPDLWACSFTEAKEEGGREGERE